LAEAAARPVWNAAPLLLQRPGCGTGRDTDDSPQVTVPHRVAPPGAIEVSIPRVAIIHLDERGALHSAMTNTGCTPSLHDDLWVAGPDGELVRPTASVLRQLQRRWVGDFRTAGVDVVQTRPADQIGA
jgi:hypothetical protein